MSQPSKPQAAPTAPGREPAPQSQGVVRLRKGEMLFEEGDNAGSMYLIRQGSIRVFKKKGDGDIEIETIRANQLIGELAFLDGNPRSASGEALSDCELVEISGGSFQQVLARIPEWVKILLRTLVARLRAASTRIRQLESSSSEFVFSEKEGKRVAQAIYLSNSDVMKVATAILLVATRWGSPGPREGSIEIAPAMLQRYGNKILQVPEAKITSILDAFVVAGFMLWDETNQSGVLLDIEFLEKLIHYMNDENLLAPSKRHDLSNRGFLVLGIVAKYLSRYPADADGVSQVNMAEVLRLATPEGGVSPFRLDHFEELVKLGYATKVTAKSTDEVVTSIQAAKFQDAARLQRALKAIESVNDQKRRVGA